MRSANINDDVKNLELYKASLKQGELIVFEDALKLLTESERQIFISILLTEPNLKLRFEMLTFLYSLGRELPKIDRKYFLDLIKIFQFMGHPDDVHAELAELEKEIQQYANKLPEEIKNQLYYIKFNGGGFFTLKGTKTLKIVSGNFYEWAQNNGFTSKVKIINSLDERIFLSIIANKQFIKDASPNLDVHHGMFTHMIQWRTIFQHQARKSFLQHSPIELYQLFGKMDKWFWVRTFDIYNGNYDSDSWGKKADEKTFRTPQLVVLKTLQSSLSELSNGLLASTMRRHIAKGNTFFTDKSYQIKIKAKHAKEYKGEQVVHREFDCKSFI